MSTSDDAGDGPAADGGFAETLIGEAKSIPPSRDGPLSIARGESIGRYVVLEELGKGGMGVVFAAYDPELDRKVALKLLHAEDTGHTDATAGRSRLLREAQAMARLSHPNVIAVHDVGTSQDRVFVAMEFIDGSTLTEWVEAEKRDWRATMRPFLAAGDGLAAAHRAGLVHRDFKPDNVMVGNDDRVCVLDFGLARPVVRRHDSGETSLPDIDAVLTASNPSIDVRLTVTGAVMGTPAYMAPEQHMGRESDARTDQFSFCVALWEALYGEKPFRGDTLAVLAFQVTQGKIAEPSDTTKVPRFVRRALERGMSRKPGGRHPSMAALLTELRRDLAQKRRRLAAGIGVVAAVAFGGYALQAATDDSTAVCYERAELDGVWDDAVRSKIREGFASTGRSYAGDEFERVDTRVSGWVERWQVQRQQACEATHVAHSQSEGALALRLSCLDHQLGALQGVSEAWQEADTEVMVQASRAAASLPDPSECADIDRLERAVSPPTDPELAARVEQLRQSVERLRALRVAGKASANADSVDELVAAARASDYRPLLAEALLEAARYEMELSKPKDAVATLDEALWAAEASGHDQMAAEAWLLELQVRVIGTSEYDAAARAARRADAALTRIGDPPEQRLRHFNGLGLVYRYQEDFDASGAKFEEGLAYAEAHGVDPVLVADLQNNYATMIKTQGKFGEAEDHLLAAKEIWIREYGPNHPTVGRVLVNLANVASGLGRNKDAVDYLERALELFRGAYGDEHHHTAAALNGLALMSGAAGEHERAKEYLLQARPALEASVGKDHAHMVNVLNNLGSTHKSLGEYEEALGYHREAITLIRKINGDDSIDVSWAYDNFGFTYEAMGDMAKAKEYYEKSLAHTTAIGADPANTAWPLTGLGRVALHDGDAKQAIRHLEAARAFGTEGVYESTDMAGTDFALAKALRAAGRDPERAIELARGAREIKATVPSSAETVVEIDAFLAAKP